MLPGMMNGARKCLFTAGCIARAAAGQAVYIAALFFIVLTAGYLVFAQRVSLMISGPTPFADGIVVLTGDEDRIAEAIRLLAKGRAARLLISGVNKATRAPQIISTNKTGRSEAFLFRCCVDLDRRALNTEDNAFEATAWAKSRGFHSLIVVTSTYHMPRALIELRQAMPDAELMPYPVKSPRLAADWWNDPATAWVLCKEYLKFVTASARYAANMLVNGSARHEPARIEKPSRTVHARMD
jgi:uncharacterized SAM-binding protein YcdF (DUF218 family)